MSLSSAPACRHARGHRGQAPAASTWPSSRSCIPRARTRARRRAASTPRSATRPRTRRRATPSTRSRAPTTWATRTRSRSCAREAPGDIFELEQMGAIFSRVPRRPARAAPVRRRRRAAHRLLGRHHRPRADPRAVRAARQARRQGVRGVPLHPARDRRGPLRRRAGLGHRPRRRAGHRGEPRHPRHRRRRAHVLRHHERLRVHRRRHVAGLARRRAAEGHGVHAVPPDHAEVERRAHHRGLPRRGRVPAQRQDGERFMAKDAPNAMELASRDVVSRAEWKEIADGRGVDGCVLLDLTHLGPKKISTRLPGSRELALDYAGVDPIREPIPVRPGAHYHMGGVDVDNWGESIIPGLWAAGEVACVSVHGANRLGGNSLMETITFGRRAGQADRRARPRGGRRRRPHRGQRRRRRAAAHRRAALARHRRARRGDPRARWRSRCTTRPACSAPRRRCRRRCETVAELREQAQSLRARRPRLAVQHRPRRSASSCRPCWSAPTASSPARWPARRAAAPTRASTSPSATTSAG